MKKYIIIFLCFQTWFLQGQSLTSKDLIGTWINQNKSVLEIKKIDAKTGAITGNYRSAVGTGERYYTLKGFVNTKKKKDSQKHQVISIAFVVTWEEYGSITSFTGFFSEKEDNIELYTQWILSRSEATSHWEHLLTGTDVFLKN